VALEHRQPPPDERELEQHEVAGQVDEARTRHPRARLGVDQRSGHLEVIRAGPAVCADLADHGVLVGRRRVGRVGQRRERGLQLGVGVGELLPELLHAPGDVLHRGDLLGRVAARLPGGPDRLRRLVLLRPQALGLRSQRARARVELEHAVEPLV
jgi:hypothetical protein